MTEPVEHQPFQNTIYQWDDLPVNLTPVLLWIAQLRSSPHLWRSIDTGGQQSLSIGTRPFQLQQLFGQLDHCVGSVLTQWRITQPAAIAKYWVNIDTDRGYGVSHCHYASILSGVFYCQTPEGSGGLWFERPDSQDCCFKTLEPTAQTLQRFLIPARRGRLLVFPSYLRHYVEQHRFSDPCAERISISFDCQYSQPV